MKTIRIVFASKKLDEEFDNLIKGKFEDKKLHKFITRAFQVPVVIVLTVVRDESVDTVYRQTYLSAGWQKNLSFFLTS